MEGMVMGSTNSFILTGNSYTIEGSLQTFSCLIAKLIDGSPFKKCSHSFIFCSCSNSVY